MNCEKRLLSDQDEPMRVLSQDRGAMEGHWARSSSSTNKRLSPPSRGGVDSVATPGEGSVRSMEDGGRHPTA